MRKTFSYKKEIKSEIVEAAERAASYLFIREAACLEKSGYIHQLGKYLLASFSLIDVKKDFEDIIKLQDNDFNLGRRKATQFVIDLMRD